MRSFETFIKIDVLYFFSIWFVKYETLEVWSIQFQKDSQGRFNIDLTLINISKDTDGPSPTILVWEIVKRVVLLHKPIDATQCKVILSCYNVTWPWLDYHLLQIATGCGVYRLSRCLTPFWQLILSSIKYGHTQSQLRHSNSDVFLNDLDFHQFIIRNFAGFLLILMKFLKEVSPEKHIFPIWLYSLVIYWLTISF